MRKPLEGLLVLEFSQFLAGPSAGLRLADLGARVIKIERPGKGEGGRQIAIKNIFIDGDSLVFHTINRNKESYAADLKNADDLARIKKLIAKADVMTHNFRPGVMEKIGLNYDSVKEINPRIIYGVVTGYGNDGPWANKPGQDLLVQSLSGLTQLSGTRNDGPVPFGLAVADIYCGSHFTQGILAALIKRSKTNSSVLVEVSLLESTLDLQFEVLTTYLNDGGKLPYRGNAKGTAHAYLSAPYGIYETSDGYLSIAMGNLLPLLRVLDCSIPKSYENSEAWFDHRDEIVHLIAGKIKEKTTAECLSLFEPLQIWCAAVLNYNEVTQHKGYKALQMEQHVRLEDGKELTTTRCPIVIDGEKLFSSKAAPKVGVDTDTINKEFQLA
jgi:crotonobetainyl-CoA:carnitine CoA-transferase CaiB-like acyl-CoA transferase